MPKHASMSQAESREPNEVELDPIIWGLLDKVPHNGEPWPKTQRTAWLNLLSLTLEMLYPEQTTTAQPNEPAHASPKHP